MTIPASTITSTSTHHVQACIIGGGVIGLATARALAMAMTNHNHHHQNTEILLLERQPTFGTGTSSRNSEVIHAGIYYPHSTLKAQLCVRGKEMMYQYCQERHLPHDKLGKLIVATQERQWKVDLPRIAAHASGNGVEDLMVLSGEDVASDYFEPEVTCCGALYSPSSGILDSHAFMLSLLADAEEYGATVAFNSSVENIRLKNRTRTGASGRGGVVGARPGIIVESQGMEIDCEIVINCAGLYADQIESMVYNDSDNQNDYSNHENGNNMINIKHTQDEMHPYRQVPRQYYAKGNYYRLAGQKNPFQHLVYPVPEQGGLGIHATIDLGGNCRFGPDVEWIPIDVHDPDEIDPTVDPDRAESFYDEVRKYWPHLKDGSLQPDYCGIRPKLGHPDLRGGPSVNADFRIEQMDGVPGFITLSGIESPGLTASMALAEEVVQHLTKDGLI
jgi:L-2-hydroxyglutarate oxidase LhgO